MRRVGGGRDILKVVIHKDMLQCSRFILVEAKCQLEP
jgi:hypothetical protein